MIRFMLLVSRQGKVRLAKWYQSYDKKQQQLIVREVCGKVLKRRNKLSNFIEWKDGKIVYKRYASLCFICFVDNEDNELLDLEIIHHFVEVLDRYFGNVCELDLIFNFHRAYFILDELLVAGELQETSKKEILRSCATQDIMMSPSYSGDGKKGTEMVASSMKRTFNY